MLAQVKHPRNFSASASRSRSSQSDELATSVWVGPCGNLECTGVRAELIPRDEEGTSADYNNGLKEHPAFDRETERVTTTSKRESSQYLRRKSDMGRFQWFTDEEGEANFLQRPPSRQKAAFPTHLADVVPYMAFQVCWVGLRSDVKTEYYMWRHMQSYQAVLPRLFVHVLQAVGSKGQQMICHYSNFGQEHTGCALSTVRLPDTIY